MDAFGTATNAEIHRQKQMLRRGDRKLQKIDYVIGWSVDVCALTVGR
jgi:hypothetical protein